MWGVLDISVWGVPPSKKQKQTKQNFSVPPPTSSSIARAFQGGQNEGEYEEKLEKLQENEENLRKCFYITHPRVRGWLRPCLLV